MGGSRLVCRTHPRGGEGGGGGLPLPPQVLDRPLLDYPLPRGKVCPAEWSAGGRVAGNSLRQSHPLAGARSPLAETDPRTPPPRLFRQARLKAPDDPSTWSSVAEKGKWANSST